MIKYITHINKHSGLTDTHVNKYTHIYIYIYIYIYVSFNPTTHAYIYIYIYMSECVRANVCK